MQKLKALGLSIISFIRETPSLIYALETTSCFFAMQAQPR
jgi:hypothetical protein